MPIYVYKHIYTPGSQTQIGNVIIPADGTIPSFNIIPELEGQVGKLINRFVDGQLSNSSLTVDPSYNATEARMYGRLTPEANRNSLNDATDANEVVMGTIVIPPNNGAKIGTMFEFISVWEGTNSASTKSEIIRINGSSVGSGTFTTSASISQRQPFQMVDANTLKVINSFTATGGGVSGSAPLVVTISNLADVGFTVTFNSKWSAAASGEFIKLTLAKIIQFNPI
jgi:hypothetical protein